MRYLGPLAIGIILVGAVVFALGLASLGESWTLTGLLLLIAGIVKVVVLRLWKSIFASGDPLHPEGQHRKS